MAGVIFCRGGGIRTPGPRERSPVFKTGAINRSTTPLCTVHFKDCKSNLKILFAKKENEILPEGLRYFFRSLVALNRL